MSEREALADLVEELKGRNAWECGEPGCDAPHVALYADERDRIVRALVQALGNS